MWRDVVATLKQVHFGRYVNILTADRSCRGETYELWDLKQARDHHEHSSSSCAE